MRIFNLLLLAIIWVLVLGGFREGCYAARWRRVENADYSRVEPHELNVDA
jgi:hypothetical protein